jgi:integrase/recombinase XerD
LTFLLFDSQCVISITISLFMLGKRARILSDNNIRDLLAFTTHTRYPLRNRVIVLLSTKAGLRAGEFANLTWPMITDSTDEIGTVIALEDRVAKKNSGRVIPLHPALGDALKMLRHTTGGDGPVITSERGGPMTPLSIVNWFTTAYRAIGVTGCSSHSGRHGERSSPGQHGSSIELAGRCGTFSSLPVIGRS